MKDIVKYLKTNKKNGTSASAAYLKEKIDEFIEREKKARHPVNLVWIAKRSGISKGPLSDMLSGKRRISATTIKKLAPCVPTINAAELILIRALEVWDGDVNKDTLDLMNEVLKLVAPSDAEQSILEMFTEFKREDMEEHGNCQGDLPVVTGVPEYRTILRQAYDAIHSQKREFDRLLEECDETEIGLKMQTVIASIASEPPQSKEDC